MSDNCNYSWQDIISDVFSALFLTTLGFVLIELIRPGSISSVINLFVLFVLVVSLSLILLLSNYQNNFHLSRSLLILVALFVSAIAIIITRGETIERVILGIVIFLTIMLSAFSLDSKKTPPAE